MTVKRDLKRIIRARMARTGEAFTTARQHVLRSRREQQGAAGTAPPEEAGAAGDASSPGGEAAAGDAGSPRGEAAAVKPEPAPSALARVPTTIDGVVVRRGAHTLFLRVVGTGEELTVRAEKLWHVMPGHVVTVRVERRFRRRGQLYGVGEVRDVRVDAPAFGLPPLRVDERGPLAPFAPPADDPEPLRELKERIAAVPRSAYEMEQVPPSLTAGDADPIREMVAFWERGKTVDATELAMEILTEDLRSIDVYAHLGNLIFSLYPEHARLHYEIGVAVGDHALGPGFSGALPWSYKNNRPFLRCLHGEGLALWQLERMEEATKVFERLLWLNPTDEQGAGRCWLEVREGHPWPEEEEDDDE